MFIPEVFNLNNFFKKIERFFMNLLLITLILLISLQLVMKNDLAYQKLKDLEYTVKSVFQRQNLIEVTKQRPKVIEVTNENQFIKKGFIVIDLLQDYSLPQVWLVKNGIKVANFSNGIVETSIKDGDLLLLDCKFYNNPLWFEITGLSSYVRNWYVGQQFRVTAEESRIGVVKFYDKL